MQVYRLAAYAVGFQVDPLVAFAAVPADDLCYGHYPGFAVVLVALAFPKHILVSGSEVLHSDESLTVAPLHCALPLGL